jgi:hypothetical protein
MTRNPSQPGSLSSLMSLTLGAFAIGTEGFMIAGLLPALARGDISPAVFIPVAEDTGAILEIETSMWACPPPAIWSPSFPWPMRSALRSWPC